MSIYKNKFTIEKEIYGLFQKEILLSRNVAVLKPVIEEKILTNTGGVIQPVAVI